MNEIASARQNAIDRGIAKYRAEAERSVAAILDAALRVAERAAPAPPKVTDIIAEAGTSNQAFYRYFSGKDELLRAVRERGARRLHDYLGHQMGKADDPAGAIEAWVRGVLVQAVDRRAARQSAAVNLQLAGRSATDDDAGTADLRALLLAALVAHGSADPERDTAAVFETVFGTLRRHLALSTAPADTDVEHLVRFADRAVTPAPIEPRRAGRR
jgi:AcrR family transcriptional regulator